MYWRCSGGTSEVKWLSLVSCIPEEQLDEGCILLFNMHRYTYISQWRKLWWRSRCLLDDDADDLILITSQPCLALCYPGGWCGYGRWCTLCGWCGRRGHRCGIPHETALASPITPVIAERATSKHTVRENECESERDKWGRIYVLKMSCVRLRRNLETTQMKEACEETDEVTQKWGRWGGTQNVCYPSLI